MPQPKGLDPDLGYRDRYLHLPLKHINNVKGLQATLTFPTGKPRQRVRAYKMGKTHIRVPREYISYEEEQELPFEIQLLEASEPPRIGEIQLTFQLRDAIQRTGFAALTEQGSGVLSLACGRGKTVVAIHSWAVTGYPGLVVVNTKDLMRQWIERIEEHTNLSLDDIGVYAADRDDWEKPITVASIQTLAARLRDNELPQEFMDYFGVAIYDEVHRLGAPFFNQTAHICDGLRWGLSATHRRDDGLDPLYKYHIGPVLYENLTQDVVPETYFVHTGLNPAPRRLERLKVRGTLNFNKLCELLVRDHRRNQLITDHIDRCLEEDRRILVLSRRVEHCEQLNSLYKESGLIHGGIPAKDRRAQLYDYPLIFATTDLAREGLDRKDLDTLMIALPIQREGWVQQTIGRIQRDSPGKQVPQVYVFEDEKIPACRTAARYIRAHLQGFGYPYTVVRSNER